MTDINIETWKSSDTAAFAKYGEVFVPRRDEQMRVVVDLLANVPAGDVLEVCCGEGKLAELYLRENAGRRVTVMDGSAEMLLMADARLSALGGNRHGTIQADIVDTSWRTPNTYAGVMSSLAVHHLDGPGKQALYRDIHDMLVPRGVFVLADLVEPTSVRSRDVAGDAWQAAVERGSQEKFGGDEATRAFEATKWNYYRYPDPLDRPSSVVDNIDWLRGAGFQDVDIVWMYAGHAVFTATKESR